MPRIPRFSPYNLPHLFKSKSLTSIIEEEPNMNNTTNEHSGPHTSGLPPAAAATAAAVAQLDIFQSLRFPAAIKQLPTFSGNPRLLHEFLNNVEEILLFIRGRDKTPYGQILLRAIRNKIEGQANEVLNMYGTPLNWDNIIRI